MLYLLQEHAHTDVAKQARILVAVLIAPLITFEST